MLLVDGKVVLCRPLLGLFPVLQRQICTGVSRGFSLKSLRFHDAFCCVARRGAATEKSEHQWNRSTLPIVHNTAFHKISLP
jgi:hypothetical protein